MEYRISHTEISRRKKAFLALSISILLGTVSGSIAYKFTISIGGYFVVTCILLLIGLFSSSFFKKISDMKIQLSDQEILRETGSFSEKYPLDKVKRIEIKWTTRKIIREIYIWFQDDKNIAITAIDSFEKFKNSLLELANPQVIVKEKHEGLDFDHWLFYPILGLLIGNLSVLGLKSLISIDLQQIKIGEMFFLAFLFVFSLYFFITTPISKRSGSQTKFQDYLTGGIMIFFVILFLALIF